MDNKGLDEIRDTLKGIVEKLQVIDQLIVSDLADLGCLHRDSIDVTTMGGGNTKKFFCPECGETIEEEINYDREMGRL